jgi:hypothetical protein
VKITTSTNKGRRNSGVVIIAVPSDPRKRPNAFAIKTPKALPSKERSLIRKMVMVLVRYKKDIN